MNLLSNLWIPYISCSFVKSCMCVSVATVWCNCFCHPWVFLFLSIYHELGFYCRFLREEGEIDEYEVDIPGLDMDIVKDNPMDECTYIKLADCNGN